MSAILPHETGASLVVGSSAASSTVLKKPTRNTQRVMVQRMRPPEVGRDQVTNKPKAPWNLCFVDSAGNAHRVECSDLRYWMLVFGEQQEGQPHTGIDYDIHKSCIVHLEQKGGKPVVHSVDRVQRSVYDVRTSRPDLKDKPDNIIAIAFDVTADGNILSSFTITQRPLTFSDNAIMALIALLDSMDTIKVMQFLDKETRRIRVTKVVGNMIELTVPKDTSVQDASNFEAHEEAIKAQFAAQ